jgi:hypothetical protein
MPSSSPMDFIRDFLNYVNKEGIYDKFDKESQQMVTSPGVEALIKAAEACLPKKLGKGEAARLMRDLSEEERDMLIKNSEEERVIDLRETFRKKIALNGGAQGIVKRLVEAIETGDPLEMRDILLDAKGLVDGAETAEQIRGVTNSDN